MRPPANPAILPIAFRNPRRPGVPLEVVPLSELRRKAPPSFLARVHRPDFHQLLFVTRGRSAHEVDFRRLDVRAGHALEVRPGQVQRFDLRPSVEGWLVLFTPELVRLPAELESRSAPNAVIELGPVRADVTFLVERLRRASGGDSPPTLRKALLHHLLHVLLLVLHERRASGTGDASAPEGLEHVFALFAREVDKRCASTRTLARYAALTGYSTKTLGRATHACAGTTAKAFIDQRVLLEARRLLAHTDMTAAEVGARLGFTEATNFIKFFERTGGEPPSSFRARAVRGA